MKTKRNAQHHFHFSMTPLNGLIATFPIAFTTGDNPRDAHFVHRTTTPIISKAPTPAWKSAVLK